MHAQGSSPQGPVGDVRFEHTYRRLLDSARRAELLREMSDVEIVQALAAASRAHDPFLANILATEAENRMRRAGIVAASAPECILSIDQEGRVRYVNDAATTLLGCGRAHLSGRTIWDAIQVFDLDGGELPPERRPSWTALREGHEARGEVQLRCGSGPLIRCAYIAAPIRRHDHVEGAVIVFHRSATE